MTALKAEIRLEARSALEACLRRLPPEHRTYHEEALMAQAIGCMTSYASSAATLHGSILVCNVLLDLRDDLDRELLIMWPAILKVKERDTYVGSAAMQFMASAARKGTQHFRDHWLNPTLSWLVQEMKRERLLDQTLLTLAKLLPVAAYAASEYLNLILSRLSGHLSDSTHHQAALEVASACAEAFGADFQPFVETHIDALFAYGLNDALVNASRSIAQHMPVAAAAIRGRLLDTVAGILAGSTFAEAVFPASRPSHGRRASMASMAGLVVTDSDQQRKTSVERRRASSFLVRARGRSASHERNPAVMAATTPLSEVPITSVILALDTISTFDFGEQPMLSSFIYQYVTPCATSPASVQIRRASIQALANHVIDRRRYDLAEAPGCISSSLVQTILHALVADADVAARESILNLLLPDLYYLLVSNGMFGLLQHR